MVTIYKAIELDPVTHQRTGGELALQAQTRQAAVAELLRLLQIDAADARIDPSRTMVQHGPRLWTIVGTPSSLPTAEPPRLRRLGPKHRHVR